MEQWKSSSPNEMREWLNIGGFILQVMCGWVSITCTAYLLLTPVNSLLRQVILLCGRLLAEIRSGTQTKMTGAAGFLLALLIGVALWYALVLSLVWYLASRLFTP